MGSSAADDHNVTGWGFRRGECEESCPIAENMQNTS